MKVYYAHCLAIYDTQQEYRDELAINSFLFPHYEIINPNCIAVQEECDRMKKDGLGADIMESIFKPLVLSCQALIFRGLPDGRIPAGVMQEITWAKKAGLPVLELPSFGYDRKMSVGLTRQYLEEVGQR